MMGLDELQSVQDDLVQKLSKTSQLIQRSRSSSINSARKPPAPQDKRQRAETQAKKELEGMISDSSYDELPEQLSVKP